MTSEHGERGHLNVLTRDHDSVVTSYGKHDRVVAFLPGPVEFYIRVDHKWDLGAPSLAQILTVARKSQGISGRWTLDRTESRPDGSSTDYFFVRA